MSTYQSIPNIVHQLDAAELAGVNEVSHPSFLRSKFLSLVALLIGTAVLAMTILGFGGSHSSRSPTPPQAAADELLLGATSSSYRHHHEKDTTTTVRACTLDECFASNCNQELAPYTCLFHNGGPHGGCSAMPWMVPETCEEECNLRGCHELTIPDTAQDCDLPCTADFCNLVGRLCGSEVPFQCTSGASTFGCSADKYMWTLRVATTSCGSCCNIQYCE